MFFPSVNPVGDENCMGETPRDLTKPRIEALHTRTLGNAFKIQYFGAI